ncbi:MAG: hypothetical protein HY347_07315 [candidate division NC10 bacterium]|nr:hypothetical protein [candidate division NC10 bacterium]
MMLERAPDQLASWVDQKCRELSSSPEARRYARLRRDELVKKFYEELRPLSLFAQHCHSGRNDVYCQPNLNKRDNFDAVIRNCSTTPETILFIQFTSTTESYEESLRMEVLNEGGSVNALGKVKVKGTRVTGHTIEVENECVLHSEVVGKNLRLIKERAQEKAKREHSEQHVLVIVIDDYFAFTSDEDIATLKDFVEWVVISPKLDFKTLYLLGASGKTLLRFELPKYR